MEFTEKDFLKARQILAQGIPGQYIFPKYFLHICHKDPSFFTLMQETSVDELPSNVITSRNKNYLHEVKVCEQKTNQIAGWQNYPKFEFFQFVMSNPKLFIPLESISYAQLQSVWQQVQNNKISFEDAFRMINLEPDEVHSFLSTITDDFKLEDD